MGTPLALVWDLIAEDRASGVFKKVGAEAKGTAAEAEALGTKFAKMGAVVGAAAIGVGVVSAKMAIDFEDSTEKLVTGAGESEDAIDGVRKGILAMAGSVGTMPEELSSGMYMIESAGFHGAHGLDVLHAAAEGAKVGGADLRTVADGLTTAMKDYSIPTSKAADVTSQLVATVGAGKTTMEDLSGALAKVLPFSANLGVSLKETMGAMATMTGEGIEAANAATMLKFTMMSLSNETPKGAKALDDVGLSAEKVNSSLGKQGLQATLDMITTAVGETFPKGSAAYNKAMASIVGGTRGMGAALALSGDHAKTFAENVKTVGGATADADGHVKNFELTQEDVSFQFDQIKAAANAYMIELGSKLLPVIVDVIGYFKEHKSLAQDLGIGLVALAGFMVAYTAATKIAAAATGTFNAALRLANIGTAEGETRISGLKLGMLGAGVAAVGFGTQLSKTHETLGALTSAAGGAAAGFAVGGPWGAAIGGAGGLLISLMHHTDDAKDSQHKLAGSLSDVTSWLNSETGALKKSAEASISKALADSGAYEAARKMGISMHDVLLAAEGNTAALGRVNVASAQYSAALSDNDDHQKLAAKNTGILMGAVDGATGSIHKSRQALLDQAEASGADKTKIDALRKSLEDAGKTHANPSVALSGADHAISQMKTLLGLLTGVKNTQYTGSVPGMYNPGHNAKGTDYWGGGLTWVGENGPELIDLQRGAKVVPNDKVGDYAAGVASSGSKSDSGRNPLDGAQITIVDGGHMANSFQGIVTSRSDRMVPRA